MWVLFYQIVIGVLILIAGYRGKKSLNIVAGILVLFTITHVFIPWLMILQFCTIGIVYFFMINKIDSLTEKEKIFIYGKKKENYDLGCTGLFGIFLLIFMLLYILVAIKSCISDCF